VLAGDEAKAATAWEQAMRSATTSASVQTVSVPTTATARQNGA
jgi:hypothetical protein